MRINRDILINIANETVAERTRTNPALVCAFLCGSLLTDNFLLGGTTDIDLVFVHIAQPPVSREIVKVSDEIHMDIAHHAQKEYEDTRELRLHPWMGPTIHDCISLHDNGHFMDFTQASVRGQFNQPENILKRVRPQAQHARQIWFSLQATPGGSDIISVQSYLRAIAHAAQAIALLTGGPLTERRFLLSFHDRAEAISRPGMYAGMLGLLGAPNVDEAAIRNWLPKWEAALRSLPIEVSQARLHPLRIPYYLRAIDALLNMSEPNSVMWPLLSTWTLATSLLPANSEHISHWQAACQQLDLMGEAFQQRLEALDVYLDLVDESIEQWAKELGI